MRMTSHFMSVLYIDTSSNGRINVSLEIDGKKDVLEKAVDKRKSQVILGMIDEVLKKHNLESKDLTNIQVNLGPGSFTGLRVGVTIANTMGTVLHIPINGNPVGKLVEPKYT